MPLDNQRMVNILAFKSSMYDIYILFSSIDYYRVHIYICFNYKSLGFIMIYLLQCDMELINYIYIAVRFKDYPWVALTL